VGKKLVIAEKPSVARELAAVMGVKGGNNRDGFLEGADVVVTWALGHLVNIAEPEEQDERWKGRWSLDQLPMIPRRFVLTVLDARRRQFEVIKGLFARSDVDVVINATDAGREGELIFRRIYVHGGCTKPIERLWASDMTEEGLKKALANLVDGERKRDLGLAAFARAEADWLIGMNFSRLFTLKAGALVTVGRVQTPVLKMLADRWREIADFKPQDYWSIEAACGVGDERFSALWHGPPDYKESKIDTAARAAAIENTCTGQPATAVEVTRKKGQQKPPLPYDLTTLQRDVNKRFGLSAQQTLTIAQELYETKKVLTYPRTDSRYLTRELFNDVLNHLRAVHGHYPDLTKEAAERIKAQNTSFECVDDKKVTDHHAIIPTAKPTTRDALSADEWTVYDMVCRRFVAAFLPAVQFSASTVWLDIAGERFKATGKIFDDKGWLVAEPWRAAEDNPLPNLPDGDIVAVESLTTKKHKTKPPSHFTDASLLGAMETAGKLVDDDELRDAMKERGLGTPATRAQIIETLVGRDYVEKQGKKLVATEKGRQAVEIVTAALPDVTSPELTGLWEKKLKDIEGGSFTYAEFMREIRALVDESTKQLLTARLAASLHPHAEVADEARIGTCPRCGGAVVESDKAFGCANWREKNGSCRFAIWKRMFGGVVPVERARELLTDGRTSAPLPLVSKAGKPYEARLKLNNGTVVLDFTAGRRPGRGRAIGHPRPAPTPRRLDATAVGASPPRLGRPGDHGSRPGERPATTRRHGRHRAAGGWWDDRHNRAGHASSRPERRGAADAVIRRPTWCGRS